MPRFVISLMLPLFLLLAACGASSTGPAAIAPTATLVVGSKDLNGCLVQQAPSPAWTAPDVIATDKYVNGPVPLTLKVGQTLEVHLTAATRWALLSPTDTMLTVIMPAGWYNASERTCVWRFTGAVVGISMLRFAGSPVCPRATACPAIAQIAEYNVMVTA